MRTPGNLNIDAPDRSLAALLESFGASLKLHVRGDRDWRIEELYYQMKVITAAEMNTLLHHLEDIRADEAEKAWTAVCEEWEALDRERGYRPVPGPLPAPPLDAYG